MIFWKTRFPHQPNMKYNNNDAYQLKDAQISFIYNIFCVFTIFDIRSEYPTTFNEILAITHNYNKTSIHYLMLH